MAGRTLQGTVTSNSMNKTIVVTVGRRTKHPKYGKYINLSSKYHVHDEKEVSKEGDLVTFDYTATVDEKLIMLD